ncbi:hypothetical protein PMAYCL1PPCAC_01005, partial [Pristionchus mayeri]
LGPLLPGLGDTLVGVGGTVGGVVGGVGDPLGGAVGGVGGVVGGVVNNVSGVVGGVGGVVGGNLTEVVDGLGGVVGGVVGGVGGVVGGVVDGVGGVVRFFFQFHILHTLSLQVGGVVGAIVGTTTTTTTTKPTTTTQVPNRCSPYAVDGVQYPNRCVTKDTAAVCDPNTSKTLCTCSRGWSDTYCSVYCMSMQGKDLEINSLVKVINEGKNTPARLIASLPALLSFLTDEQRVEMSYTVEDMILEATYEQKQLNVKESFTLFNDPSLGNCFTFNHFNDSHHHLARGPGERYGLRVTLDFQVDEYVPWVEAAGIYTFVHPIGQNVYLESVKHSLPPGIADQVAMKKYRFFRMQNFLTKCAATKANAQSFYFPGEYSVDGCLRSCYQDSVHLACGCMDPSYSRRPGVKSCNFEQLACIDEISTTRGDPYYWPECTCPMPCGEEEYRYETSRAMRMMLSRVLGLTGGFAGVLLGASMVFISEVFMLVARIVMIGCGNLQMVNALKMRRIEKTYK